MQVNFREIWYNYRSEVVFFLILSVCVALGHWLSHYIPTELTSSDDNILWIGGK